MFLSENISYGRRRGINGRSNNKQIFEQSEYIFEKSEIMAVIV
jgi:hypothetical protein